jgi:flavoprotein
VRGKVSEYSCVGVGSCMMPLDQGLLDTSLTVSENSCQGCYSCINITGSAVVGYESCLGFSACGDIAGNVSIGNGSCYGLKVRQSFVMPSLFFCQQ